MGVADEMGLGKTIQAISFMMCLRHEKLSSKPFLVIAPKSTLPGWEQVIAYSLCLC
jgi:SNF2 family DNA or RNA helicase